MRGQTSHLAPALVMHRAPTSRSPAGCTALFATKTRLFACCRPGGSRAEWCNYYVCAADGTVSRCVNIDVSRPQMMHDFCITRNYAIFLDNALVFDGAHVAKGGSIPFVSDTTKPCRIGVVRKPGDVGDDSEAAQNGQNGQSRENGKNGKNGQNGQSSVGSGAANAANGTRSTNGKRSANGKSSSSGKAAAGNGKAATGSEVQWFEVPPFVCMHTINAWEVDDDTICVTFCQCASDSLRLRLCHCTPARPCVDDSGELRAPTAMRSATTL